MQIVGAILFLGVPVLVCIVLPIMFINDLDCCNPSDPDMW